jgi:hypothetical protein
MAARSWMLAVVILGFGVSSSQANDWIFDYGPYTADKTTGRRVDQYKKAKTARQIPYSQYFSTDGPSPYIPYWYYQDELGPLNGMYGGGMPYGGGTNATPTF